MIKNLAIVFFCAFVGTLIGHKLCKERWSVAVGKSIGTALDAVLGAGLLYYILLK